MTVSPSLSITDWEAFDLCDFTGASLFPGRQGEGGHFTEVCSLSGWAQEIEDRSTQVSVCTQAHWWACLLSLPFMHPLSIFWCYLSTVFHPRYLLQVEMLEGYLFCSHFFLNLLRTLSSLHKSPIYISIFFLPVLISQHLGAHGNFLGLLFGPPVVGLYPAGLQAL